MSQNQSPVSRWLEKAPSSVFTTYAVVAAFSVYFCMYAFRKPFSAAEYEGLAWFGLTFKGAAVLSQLIGYVLSKYVGVKVCSEITRHRRAGFMIALIFMAEAALLLFAVLPPSLKILAIFFNGLPLGMIWGLVVSYLEGRRTSDILLAGLSCSFIMSSAVVKDIGRWLMLDMSVSQFWMPFVTGLMFFIPFLLFTWMLNQLPEPSEADIKARVKREPMNGRQRIDYYMRFFFGMTLLIIVYTVLTAFRDIRDNFQADIFAALGYTDELGIFSQSDIPVSLIVMGAMAALNWIDDNYWGLMGAFGIMIFGVLLLAGGTILFQMGVISGMAWMILTGLGSYLAYVPYNSVLFERIVAATRVVSTAVFTIYVADASGYTGAIVTLLLQDTVFAKVSRLEFFIGLNYVMAGVGTVLLIVSAVYFSRKSREAAAAAQIDPESCNSPVQPAPSEA
ncbi:MAG: hypothetical protein GC154_10015 [bacterium]|nr:hypothetical protein [bacterium]